MDARRPRRAGVRTATSVARREFCGMDEIALLGAMSGARLGGDRMRRLRVQGAWGVAVGCQIRNVTRPCAFRSDTLTVEVRDRAWLTELERLAPRIAARLTALLPGAPVRKVVFRIGPVVAQGSAGTHAMRGRGDGDAPPGNASGMRDFLEAVEDRTLRDRLEGIIDRYLRHKSAAG